MPLEFRDKGSTFTQIAVMCGELCIATISKNQSIIGSTKGECWSWNFSLDVTPRGFVRHGHVATRDEAMAKIERNWQTWLAASGLREAELV